MISDSTGATAESVVRAALRQFPGAPRVPVQLFPNVSDRPSIERILRMAAAHQAFVVTSLVTADHRNIAYEVCGALRVPHIDVLANMMDGIAQWLGESPERKPGLLRRPDEAYFRRMEAIEFTIKMDDGKEPRMIHQADIVLTGVSRTSKTPLSVFLGYKGYKVANVPLVLHHEPPRQLWDIDPGRVFALTIDPTPLKDIRQQRIRTMRMVGDQGYGDMDYILAELEEAEQLFRRNRQWTLINVTNKAIEETSSVILSALAERGLEPRRGEAGQL